MRLFIVWVRLPWPLVSSMGRLRVLADSLYLKSLSILYLRKEICGRQSSSLLWRRSMRRRWENGLRLSMEIKRCLRIFFYGSILKAGRQKFVARLFVIARTWFSEGNKSSKMIADRETLGPFQSQ